MSEEELERIQRLKENDSRDAANALLDQQVIDAEHDLRILQERRKRLEEKNKELNIQMTEIEEENEQLSKLYTGVSGDISNRGNFFDQLRNLEAMLEEYRGQIQGLKAVNYNLTSEINKTESQIRQFTTQLAELEDKGATAEAERSHRLADLTQARAQLTQLDEELEQVTKDCIDIKEIIKSKANELRSVSAESISQLLTQKRFLESELRTQTEKLQALRNEERDSTIREQAYHKLRQNDQANKLSASVWMSQRISLVARVKKAREELDLLQNRQRNVFRSSSRNDTIKDTNKISDRDIKYALACEIAELQKEPPKFLRNVLETEQNFQKEMESQLEDLDRTTNQINEFKISTMELMHEQEITASKSEEIALLKKELAELRGKL